MKILHTADLHLREYKDERWETLEELITIGKETKIEIFVVSGDLFDKDIDAESLRPQIRDIFSNNDFKVVLICGNHDSASYKSGLYFGEDVIILTNLMNPFEYQDVSIWGMPYESTEKEEVLNKLRTLAKVLNPQKKNILLYHGELLDAFFSRKDFGDEGEKRYMPVKLSYFKNLNIDYVLAGHFHAKFDIRRLENRGYFIYPGSPVSITKRETGRRKINIFEVGKPPGEYPLDTPHFEEVVIEFNPFRDKNPTKVLEKYFNNLHTKAKVILTVKGFLNSETIGMSEIELKNRIKKIATKKCIEEPHYEFRDMRVIFEDDLFKKFVKELEQTDYNEEERKQMLNTAIKAMMEVRL